MRSAIIFTTALVFAGTAAMAQQDSAQTLDGQMQRRGAQVTPVAKMPASEWPASASQPAPAAAPAPTVYRARDGEIIDSVGSDAIPALPLSVMQAGAIKFVTGGIGDEELAQLKSVENDFNVRMLISQVNGEFIGATTVRVMDSANTELVVVEDAGPYVYMALPQGAYMFDITTAGGERKAVKVTVPASGYIKPVVRF